MDKKDVKIPVSFGNVTYFKKTFSGDLVITEGVIYYFARINIEGQREKRRQGIAVVTRHFGLIGIAAEFAIVGAMNLTDSLSVGVNDSLLKKQQIWREGDTSQTLQLRLDDYVKELKKEAIDINSDGLIKPLRFTPAEVKNMKIGGTLRFDTEYDSHDFRIGMFQAKKLRESLWIAGFR